MDETLRWGPDRRRAGGVLLLAIVASVVALTTTDAAGRLLAVGAAVCLAAWALSDLLFWPRILVDDTGLRVRTPTVRAVWPWPTTELRVDERRRFSLTSRTLELDGDTQLVVFSRWALGADPREVYIAIEARRPRSGDTR